MSSSKLIHQGTLISLYSEKVELPNDNHTYFDIVKHPGGAVVVAINDQSEICLLKQWRHALQQFIWELPAGCLEPGEPPLETAKRELEEEAGVTAFQWTDLGKICSTPGFCNELLYLFLAEEIAPGTAKLDEAEQLEAHWLKIEEVKSMVLNGEIIDSKTLATFTKLDYWRSQTSKIS